MIFKSGKKWGEKNEISSTKAYVTNEEIFRQILNLCYAIFFKIYFNVVSYTLRLQRSP
jgi:hypothetical protein